MQLTEILPSIRLLNAADKLRLIRVLATDMNDDARSPAPGDNGLPENAIQLSERDALFMERLLENPPEPVNALQAAVSKHKSMLCEPSH